MKPRCMTKLKHAKSGITIQWTQGPDGCNSESHSVTCSESPTRELKNALSMMVTPLIDLCDLPRAWVMDIKIIGVTLSNSDTDRGLTISALRNIAGRNCPMVLNTPHAIEEDWPAGCEALLVDLEREAMRYLDGHRAQMELPLDGDGETAAKQEDAT